MSRFGKSTVVMATALLLLSSCGQPGPAPEPRQADSVWTKLYGGDVPTVCGNVLPAENGGYFIVRTTNLEFEPERSGDVYLVRTDAAGEVLWEKVYGGDGYDGGLGLTKAGDGSLLIVGVTTSYDSQGIDALLLKVGQDGKEVWRKTFGGPLDEYVGAIAATPDGGYILGGNIVNPNDVIADAGAAGYGGFEGRANLYLLKVDADGNEIWSRAYYSEDNILASGGALTPDGGFLVLATIMYFPEPDDDLLLILLDGNGNDVWSRAWEEDKCTPQNLIRTSDGGYLITASYKPLDATGSSKEDYLFIKVDGDGNEIWRSVFGDPDMIDYGVVVAETTDGGFVAAGERTKDLYTWDADISLVKIDGLGQPVWQKNQAASHTMLSTILQAPDGGFLLAGARFMDPDFNILLMKTDSEGNMAQP